MSSGSVAEFLAFVNRENTEWAMLVFFYIILLFFEQNIIYINER